MNEIILPNTLTLDEHIERILNAKTRLQLSVIEMAITINDAISQLDNSNDSVQEILAERIGMSQGTLSKWISIGSNESLVRFKDNLPGSFSTLYQLTVLDKQYQTYYGKDKGVDRFVDVLEKKITPDIEKIYVDDVLKNHRDTIKKIKTKETQGKIENAFGKSKALKGNVFNLETLIESKKYFSTFIIIPTSEQLSRWKSLELDDYIYEEYPLAELRKTSHSGTLQCIFKTSMKDIETALKCLYAFGFVYRDTLIPEQKHSGFKTLVDNTVFVRGERGLSKKNDVTISSDSIDDILKYGEEIGFAPYLLVGETTDRKDWVCCIE